MRVVTGRQISQRLIEALGLPKNTTSFELRVAANEFVTVRCEYLPEGDPVEIVAAIAEYNLIQRDESKQEEQSLVELMGYDAWLRWRTECEHRRFMERTGGSGAVFYRSKVTGKEWTKEERDARRAASAAAWDALCASQESA